jgi:AP endonuclease-1
MPPKRKVIEESSVDGSSGLSSPLSHDLDQTSEEQKPTAAKKRRVAQASKGNTIKTENKEEKEEAEVKPAPTRQTRKRVAVKAEEEEGGAEEPEDLKPAPKKQPRKKVAVKEEATGADGDDTAIAKPTKTKRKTKEEKEAEAMPLAARTIGHKLFIGAHVSSAGGQYFFRIQLYSIDSMHKNHTETQLLTAFFLN